MYENAGAATFGDAYTAAAAAAHAHTLKPHFSLSESLTRTVMYENAGAATFGAAYIAAAAATADIHDRDGRVGAAANATEGARVHMLAMNNAHYDHSRQFE
jgi:hypothetical protein